MIIAANSAGEKTDGTVKVTVIIPAFRAGAFLGKAAGSALQQTERNIEVIIIDDCSPDDTWAVAQGIAAQDKRVRLVRHTENRGKSYVVNKATAEAKGEWIAILDADDWYAPERLERLVNAAEAANVDMVADNHVLFDSKANAYAGNTFPNWGKNNIIGLDAFLAVSDPTTSSDYGLLKPVFRASFIREHAIAYYEPARLGEDYYVLLCFFVAGGRALLYDGAYYYYTQPYGTISHQWAQEGRKRYNYESMQRVHNHFVDLFRAKLNASQLQKLSDRGQGIAALISFYQIRECVAGGDILGAISRLPSAPLRFWPLVVQRAHARLKGVLQPQSGAEVSVLPVQP